MFCALAMRTTRRDERVAEADDDDRPDIDRRGSRAPSGWRGRPSRRRSRRCSRPRAPAHRSSPARGPRISGRPTCRPNGRPRTGSRDRRGPTERPPSRRPCESLCSTGAMRSSRCSAPPGLAARSLPTTRAAGRNDGGTSHARGIREFALRGNVVDLAIGVIIGAAFGKIVEFDRRRPLHADRRRGHRRPRFLQLLHPARRRRAGRPAYADAKKQGAVLGWGNFVTVAINFLIIAFVLSWSSRAMNRLRTAGGREGRCAGGAGGPGRREAAGGDPRPPGEAGRRSRRLTPERARRARLRRMAAEPAPRAGLAFRGAGPVAMAGRLRARDPMNAPVRTALRLSAPPPRGRARPGERHRRGRQLRPRPGRA